MQTATQQQSAPQQSTPQQSNQQTSMTPQAPDIDSIIKAAWGENPDTETSGDIGENQQQVSGEPKRSLADQALELERERYRQRKQVKDNEGKSQREISDLKKQLDEMRALIHAPRKTEGKKSPKTFEEMMDSIDSGDADEAQEQEDQPKGGKKNFTLEEVQELMEAKFKERDDLSSQERTQQEISSGQSRHVREITDFAKADADKFPMFDGFPEASQYAFDLIKEDWNKKSDRYGDEYADNNMLDISQACEYVNKHLESQFESMLQSNTMVKRLTAMLGKRSATGNSKPVQTLSSDFDTPSGSLNLSEEERIARAISAMDGSFNE